MWQVAQVFLKISSPRLSNASSSFAGGAGGLIAGAELASSCAGDGAFAGGASAAPPEGGWATGFAGAAAMVGGGSCLEHAASVAKEQTTTNAKRLIRN